MIVFYLFILTFVSTINLSCKSQKIQETLEQRTIREGKSYAVPEPNLFSSSKLKLIVKDFPEIVSSIYANSIFYFPEKITQSYSIQDIYSFFQIDNIYVLPEKCSKSGCPKVDCQIKQEGPKNITKIDVQGECFNDIFEFSGRIAFEDVSLITNSDFLIKYNMDLKDWIFRGVETGERVFYTGGVSFISERKGNTNSMSRKISVKGNSFVGENKNEEQINFEHEFYFLEMNEGSTKTVISQTVDYRNKFCFARTSGTDYIFSCERAYLVEKLIAIFQGDGKVSIAGDNFLIYGKDKSVWFEIDFSATFTYNPCNFISGYIKILSGDEELILEYKDKYYGQEGCNFICPTSWIWKKKDGQTQNVGCLP